jgi:hypothetical protein
MAKEVRLVLSRTPEDRRKENPKLPYFELSLPPENDGGEWRKVGAFWKAKSGAEGKYSGFLNEGIELNLEGEVQYDKSKKRDDAESGGAD